MSLPKWITPAGDLGIVPELEYYEFPLDAYDEAGGTLVYSKVSGKLPVGIQVASTGKLQGIPISEAGANNNVTYTFTIRVTNTSDNKISDRTFSLTITNVAPPVIIPRNVDLGVAFDGDIINLQLVAEEFIAGGTLTWSLKSGQLPAGLTLSSSGLISGYIIPIPAVGPSSTPGWDDTPWDELAWQFPLGASKKSFNFTVEVYDGVNYDASTYTLLVYPKSSLSADSTGLTVDTTQVKDNVDPKHLPIITTTQSNLVAERQGGYFSFQVKAIDLDGDTLVYTMANVSTGGFDENASDTVPYIKAVVTDGNLYAGTTSLYGTTNKPALINGSQVQVLYPDPSTGLTLWHLATVSYYTTVRLTGNTVISGTVGSYLTQSLSGANAKIASISSTTGTIQFSGNVISANIGDYITQGSANAVVTASVTTQLSATVTFLTGTFTTGSGSGNIAINGTTANTYPSSVTCQADIGAVYTNSNTFTLNSIDPAAIANIGGVSTNATPTTIVSVGVNIGSLIDETNTKTYDSGKFDQGQLILPLNPLSGASSIIDSASGWITGTLPPTTANETDYQFEVTVSKSSYPQYSSSVQLTLQVLGDLNNTITWLTPSNLGTIENGKISDLFVKAISSKGKVLEYTYTSGAAIRLPQGLELLSNGLISGRVSFELFSLDMALDAVQGKTATTFDGRTTTFDNTYSFSITARDYDNTVSATQIFTIQVVENNIKPYEDLYLKALLTSDQRDEFQSIIQDQTIFPLDLIYRVEDPYYGVVKDLKALFLAGLNPSLLSTYADAVETNHYTKRISFGPVKTAVARDSSYDVVEIATGNVVGTFQDVIGFIPTDFSLGYTVSASIPDGTALSNEHIKYEVVYVEILDDNTNASGQGPANTIDLTNQLTNPYYDQSGNTYTTAYPNAFSNMEASIVATIGYANKGALPDWMTTLQTDGSVLGFTRAVVLAYTKPGAGQSVAWRYAQAGYNLNELDFSVDRYELNNTYSANYDISANTFVKSAETTFDRYPSRNDEFRTSGTVDYAVSIPFEAINGKSLSQIAKTTDASGVAGFDGITNIEDGQTLVFYQQEYQTSTQISDIYNQGWSDAIELWDKDGWDLTTEEWDQSGYVPGYKEWLASANVITGTYSVTNQRIGVWQISIDSDSIVTLNYANSFPVTTTIYDPIVNRNVQTSSTISQISYYTKLFVRNGYTHGGVNIYYDPKIKIGKLYPSYSVIPQQIKIISTKFDGNGTRFIDNRDKYTVPESGDKYIKFAKTGVFT